MEYRAAYIPAEADSTGGGIVLTLPEDSHLSDEDLIAAALPILAECNAAAMAAGMAEYDETEIEIGMWSE